jgi:hypothetical protein
VAPSDAQMTQATVRKNATSDRSFCQNSFRYRSIFGLVLFCEGEREYVGDDMKRLVFRVLVVSKRELVKEAKRKTKRRRENIQRYRLASNKKV